MDDVHHARATMASFCHVCDPKNLGSNKHPFMDKVSSTYSMLLDGLDWSVKQNRDLGRDWVSFQYIGNITE
jgi:hypothetical protein